MYGMSITLLEQIGLTKSEISVYEALLELGNSTTGPIVDKSRASSSKIYEILERLIQKGLVSVVVEGGTKHFEAASPQRILDYLNEKKQQLSEQEEAIKKILPELELKKTLAKYKTEATLFRGLKGMETAFNDILKTCKTGEAVCVYVVGHLDNRVHAFFTKHYAERAKKGIITKTIYSEIGRQYYDARKHIPCSEGKVLPGATTSPATINIYGNKVLLRMGDSEDLITVLINNKSLAASFKQQFDGMWNQKVQSYEGYDVVVRKFESMLDELESGDEYYVLGASYGFGKAKLRDWFFSYHKKRVQKGIKVKLLSVPDDYDDIILQLSKTGDPQMKTGQVKKLPTELSSPMQINLYKNNKVLFFVWAGQFTCFEIESEILYKNFKNYFDQLWGKK
jgi:sugar-specific transcriptional regulator TrmB